MIAAIERQILDRLRRGLGTAWRIEPFPDDPEAFDLASAAATALVHYIGSRYERPAGLGGGSQVRRPSFAVHLYLRNLAGPRASGVPDARASRPISETPEIGGGYSAIDDVRLALQAAPAVDGAGGVGLEVVRDELAEQSGGLWHWLVEVRAQVAAVPRPRPVAAPFLETPRRMP